MKRYEEDPWPTKGVGVDIEPPAPKRPAQRLRNAWVQEMAPLCISHNTIVLTKPVVFNSGIAQLRKAGLDDAAIIERFILFAKEVRAGSYNVRGKEAWLMFIRIWPKLQVTGGANSYTESDEDDWAQYTN